jgi:hypothetical protein
VCADCWKNRRSEAVRLKRAARTRRGSENYAGDRNVRKILQEIAEKDVRILYDRDAKLGEIPANLQHSYRLGLDADAP